MLCVEKDDPREALNQVIKASTCKNNATCAFSRHRHCWWLFISQGILLTAIQVVQHSTEMPDNISKIKN
jgi:hypothetical protein